MNIFTDKGWLTALYSFLISTALVIALRYWNKRRNSTEAITQKLLNKYCKLSWRGDWGTPFWVSVWGIETNGEKLIRISDGTLESIAKIGDPFYPFVIEVQFIQKTGRTENKDSFYYLAPGKSKWPGQCLVPNGRLVNLSDISGEKIRILSPDTSPLTMIQRVLCVAANCRNAGDFMFRKVLRRAAVVMALVKDGIKSEILADFNGELVHRSLPPWDKFDCDDSRSSILTPQEKDVEPKEIDQARTRFSQKKAEKNAPTQQSGV